MAFLKKYINYSYLIIIKAGLKCNKYVILGYYSPSDKDLGMVSVPLDMAN